MNSRSHLSLAQLCCWLYFLSVFAREKIATANVWWWLKSQLTWCRRAIHRFALLCRLYYLHLIVCFARCFDDLILKVLFTSIHDSCTIWHRPSENLKPRPRIESDRLELAVVYARVGYPIPISSSNNNWWLDLADPFIPSYPFPSFAASERPRFSFIAKVSGYILWARSAKWNPWQSWYLCLMTLPVSTPLSQFRALHSVSLLIT